MYNIMHERVGVFISIFSRLSVRLVKVGAKFTKGQPPARKPLSEYEGWKTWYSPN